MHALLTCNTCVVYTCITCVELHVYYMYQTYVLQVIYSLLQLFQLHYNTLKTPHMYYIMCISHVIRVIYFPSLENDSLHSENEETASNKINHRLYCI